MNAKSKKELAESTAVAVTETIMEALEEAGPQWQDALILLCHDKDEIFISLTEEDEFDQRISWKQFEEMVVESDEDVMERFLPKFEALVEKMREILHERA